MRDRDRVGKCCPNFSPLVPKNNLQYPSIKCTARFKRSYIELDDEMISVITDVEGIQISLCMSSLLELCLQISLNCEKLIKINIVSI